MSERHDEPSLSQAQRRVLGALLLSLALHAAILGLLGAPGRPGKPVLSAPIQVSFLWQTHRPVDAGAPPVLAGTQAGPVVVAQPGPPAPAEPPVRTAEPVRHQPQTDAPLPAAAPVPVLQPPAAATPVYYSARELDALPRAVQSVAPDLPAFAVEHHLSGWVLLNVRLRADGHVESVKVVESSPPGIFDEAARQVFLQSVFQPGQRGGEPVNAQFEVKMTFQ